MLKSLIKPGAGETRIILINSTTGFVTTAAKCVIIYQRTLHNGYALDQVQNTTNPSPSTINRFIENLRVVVG